MHASCWLSALIFVGIGCGKKETYPQSPFRYQLDARGLALGELEVRVNGTPLVRREGSFEVPANLLLADPKTRIEVTLTTSCGPTAVVLRSVADVADEKARRSTATSFIWELVTADVSSATLYLDNRFGGKAATAKVGTSSFALKAAEARVEKVMVGSCDLGRRVEIDGTPAGELPAVTDREAVIVNAAGDQCYLLGTGWYSQLDYKPGELPSDAQVFKPKGHVAKVRAVDYFPASAMPEQKRVDHAGATESVAFLEPIACDLAVKLQTKR